MLTLRPHQQEAKEACLNHLRNGRGNGVVVAPTSWGKSLLPAAIAAELDEPVLVFQPSLELLQQNLSKMHSYDIMPAVFSASAGSKNIAPVTLATIGSAINKPKLFKGFRTIIIDECHTAQSRHKGAQSMYRRFWDMMGQPKMIGMTASPWKLMSNSFGAENRFLTRMKDTMWHEVIYVKQIADLKREGYLADMEYFFHRGIDPTQLVLNSTGSEFTEASIRAAMAGGDWEAKVINMIERLIRHGRKSILVFVPFVADAQRIASFLPGIAQVVWGDMPADERAKAIDGFKDGSIKVVLNVAVLGIGFDHPALDTIIDASPTMSLAKYYQRMGRGLRQHPSKKSTYILDMVGNSKMFGKVEDLRITKDFRGRWVVMSGDRQLTNKILRRPVEVMATPTYP